MSIKDRAKFILRSYLSSTGADDLLDKAKSAIDDLFDGDGEKPRRDQDYDEIDLDRIREDLFGKDGASDEELDRLYREEFGDLGTGRGGGRRKKAPGRGKTAALAKHYRTLELKPGASYEEVRTQYKKLMKKYHPDRFAHDPKKQAAATKKSQALGESFDVLERALKKKT